MVTPLTCDRYGRQHDQLLPVHFGDEDSLVNSTSRNEHNMYPAALPVVCGTDGGSG